MRQIRDAIDQRMRTLFLANAALTEWSTRTIAQFIAATTGKEGASLSKAAAKIRLDFDGSGPRDDTDDEAPGADDPAVYVEQGSQAENKPGSFEALTRGLR